MLLIRAFALVGLAGFSYAGSPPATCMASAYVDVIGQPEGSIPRGDFPAGLDYRIVHPGDAVTKDYNAARVNFEIGSDGTVQAVECY